MPHRRIDAKLPTHSTQSLLFYLTGSLTNVDLRSQCAVAYSLYNIKPPNVGELLQVCVTIPKQRVFALAGNVQAGLLPKIENSDKALSMRDYRETSQTPKCILQVVSFSCAAALATKHTCTCPLRLTGYDSEQLT